MPARQPTTTLLLMLFVHSHFLFAQVPDMDVTLGYLWLDRAGSEAVYRSQVNQEDGPLLRALRVEKAAMEGGWLDRFRFEASGFGADPHGRLNLRLGQTPWYRLSIGYTRYEHFNALPGFADPFQDGAFGQHSVDRTRQRFDLSLTLLPRHLLQPMITYQRNTYVGPSRTTYHLGLDEFQVSSDLDEREWELRAGLRYGGARIQAEVWQGWRQFDGTERRTAASEDGNNDRPVLGEELFLDDLEGTSRFEAKTPLTSAMLRVAATDQIRLVGSFIFADMESESHESEMFSGQFASFRINRFFNGGHESIRAKTQSPSARGNLRAAIAMPASFELDLGYTYHDREWDGNALITTLFLDSILFGNGDPTDYERLIDAETRLEKEENVFDVQVTNTAVDHFIFKAGWSRREDETRVEEDLAQIVISGGQQGSFSRSIDQYTLGGTYRRDGNRISMTWRREEANTAVIRTDFHDRDSVSCKARTRFSEKFHCSLNAQWVSATNPSVGINHDLDLINLGADMDVFPTKGLRFRLAYGLFDLESEVSFRDPLFAPQTSIHKENGDDLSCEVRWQRGRVTIESHYGRYDSDGVIAFTLKRGLLRAGFDITEKLRAIAEARYRDYAEATLPRADYDANTYALLLGWKR